MPSATELTDRFAYPSNVGMHENCLACIATENWLTTMHEHRVPAYPAGPLRQMPTWLRDHFDWGVTQWPAHLCDLLTADTVDCGVFAALASRLLRAHHVPHARAQLILHATAQETTAWGERWAIGNGDPSWLLTGESVYHEAVAVLDGARLVLFDTTDMQPVDPWTSNPVGRLTALRITPDSHRLEAISDRIALNGVDASKSTPLDADSLFAVAGVELQTALTHEGTWIKPMADKTWEAMT